MASKHRCEWAESISDNPLYLRYHDEEWGVPVHNDRKLFEMIILEGAQAGLSWSTVLNKRQNYRKAMDGFDAKKMAKYDAKKIAALLKNEGLIRNKLKMKAAVDNAKAFLEVQKEFKSFDKYVWNFVGGKPIRRSKVWRATSPESDALSKDLKKRGFNFVGSTIIYAWMQACGLVNDHSPECFRARVKTKKPATAKTKALAKKIQGTGV